MIPLILHVVPIPAFRSLNEQVTASVAYQLLDAILYLHKENIVVGHIDVDHILVLPSTNQEITVRVANYGLK